MSEPFIGEIRMFAGNFAPRGWAMCDGQLLSIADNTALFSLLGTAFGGDGETTFGLPDFRGRVPIHVGTGPGLSPRGWGQRGGAENVTLTSQQFPPHSHALRGARTAADAKDPTGAVPAATGAPAYGGTTNMTRMNPRAVEPAGSGAQPHNNVQPFLTVHFIIALFGVYPSRN